VAGEVLERAIFHFPFTIFHLSLVVTEVMVPPRKEEAQKETPDFSDEK
jgi:hypothetical protein